MNGNSTGRPKTIAIVHTALGWCVMPGELSHTAFASYQSALRVAEALRVLAGSRGEAVELLVQDACGELRPIETVQPRDGRTGLGPTTDAPSADRSDGRFSDRRKARRSPSADHALQSLGRGPAPSAVLRSGDGGVLAGDA